MIERIIRVVRGGAWFGNPVSRRAAFRDSSTPKNRSSYIGFRLVVRVEGEE